MEKISIVVPGYNEEASIPFFYEEILKIQGEFLKRDVEFELIFIDDGSKDKTLFVIKELQKKDERVHFVSFSRNFGKEAAIYAGLEFATGDYVVLMDADLQDPPSYLMEMYLSIKEEGYDSVATRRSTRKGEPVIRSFFARMFYQFINKIAKTEFVDGARDYRLMKREMVDAILSMCEYNRFTKGIFGWVGFNTKWLEYENVERVAGETKWSFFSLFKYSLEGILGFSTAPLTLASFVGMLFFVIAFVFMILIIIRTLVFGDPVAGWPSMICIFLFCSGLQLFCMGIIGEYLAKTYLETKHRPIYIAKEKK